MDDWYGAIYLIMLCTLDSVGLLIVWNYGTSMMVHIAVEQKVVVLTTLMAHDRRGHTWNFPFIVFNEKYRVDGRMKKCLHGVNYTRSLYYYMNVKNYTYFIFSVRKRDPCFFSRPLISPTTI